MISNHLSSNFKVFKQEYKNYIWASALTIMMFIFVKIVVPLLNFSNYLTIKNVDNERFMEKLLTLNDYLIGEYMLNKMIIILLAIILAISIFSYLHNRKQVDFYHSLPISRNSLFFIKYLLGIVIVVPIIIISNIVLYGILKIILGENLLQFRYVLKFISFDILFFITIYSITVFSSIICGSTIASLMLTFILINIFSIVVVVVDGLSQIVFKNLIDLSYLFEYTVKYNPVLCYFSLIDSINHTSMYNINFGKIDIFITYIIITLVIIIISLILFKARKSEKSNTCIAFKYAKTIIKYFIVCVGSILTGMLFYLISENSLLLYLGIVMGCIILHCIVEIIYDFDFRAIFKNWYSIICCAIICLVIIFSYKFDIFKREDYVPDIEKISNVSIMINANNVLNNELNNIQDEDIIKNINDLHKIFINKKNNNNNNNNKVEDTYNFNITYKLRNGKILCRNINFSYSDYEATNILKNILNNKKYIKEFANILYKDIANNDINFKLYNKNFNIYNLEEFNNIDKKYLIKVLKKDIEESGIFILPEDIIFNLNINVNSWNYGLERNYYNLGISNKYKNTLDYLSKLGIK
ncbi:hypothetical protein [[Clostridium] colinum]|uniref:hypothetical protein n=1 Tax=[Clostridium] colinum TaxID=36835 RepID=UPI0020244B1D|nr:hypothetical protein [[Clostridium] colinum]